MSAKPLDATRETSRQVERDGPVLVTGSRGYLGVWVVARLRQAGIEVREYDADMGLDIFDASALGDAVSGCSAVVHLAALPHDNAGTPDRIMYVNVLGMWRVLGAAADAGISRFVYVSSAMATGYFQYGQLPATLPLDDAAPARPRSAYSVSKLSGELLCAWASETWNMTTVCLRPTMVVAPEDRAHVLSDFHRARRDDRPDIDFGAWIDIRDVAEAVLLSLVKLVNGHHVCLLSAGELVGDLDAQELAKSAYPDVPYRGGSLTAPLVLSRVARDLLGWYPQFAWDETGEND